MLTKNSIILAEPIAMACTAITPSSGIINGLMELSYGAMPYTQKYRDEIVETTAENEHTAAMEAVTTALAESIRKVFSQISTYGVGFARELTRELDHMDSRDRVIDTATAALDVRYVNLDNDFLVSSLYPQGPKNTNFSYSSTDLSALSRLQFNTDLCRELAETYIDASHPDVVSVMADEDCDADEAFYTLFSLDALQELFAHNGSKFNFLEIKSVRMPLLFKMYVVLSKMYASEDPVKALVGGTLTDYREYVSLLWNGLSAYLSMLKKYVGVMRARGLAMVETRQVRLDMVKREYPVINTTLEYEQLHGNATVFYTQAALETLMQNNYCLRDWVIGRVVCNLKGERHVTDVDLMQGDKLRGVIGKFIDQLEERLREKRRDVSNVLFTRAVHSFVQKHEELKDFVQGLDVPGIGSEKVIREMHKGDERIGHSLAYYIDKHPEMERFDAVMSCGVVGKFLRAIGCKLAAQVLTNTERLSEDDDLIDKRKRLHAAVTRVLVDELLG